MSESNGYLSPFIGDGYDRVATIPARDGRWSAVRLRYRPFGADEISVINAKAGIDFQGGYCTHYAEAMAGKILDWDIQQKDAQGKLTKLPVSADAIRSLDFDFYIDLKSVVSGEHPEWVEGGDGGGEKNS